MTLTLKIRVHWDDVFCHCSRVNPWLLLHFHELQGDSGMLATMCYNEESELTRYIWANYAHLMSPREQEVGHVIQARLLAKRPSSSSRRLPLEELPATRIQDLTINYDLASGSDPYRQRAALKLLLAQPERVKISRCQRCKRILRAPDAQACFWCGLDWHDGRVWKPREK